MDISGRPGADYCAEMVIFGWPGTGYGFNTVVKSCVFLCVCVSVCFLCVFSPCVFSVWFSVCVFSVRVLCVFSPCVSLCGFLSVCFLSVFSVFSLCVFSVFCVFSLCVFRLCFLSVFSVCVFSVCVFSLCFLSVCFLSVFSLCVFSLCVFLCVCFLSAFSVCVFSLCVFSLCFLSVFSVCVFSLCCLCSPSLCFLCVFSVCVLCLRVFSVFSGCVFSLCFLCVFSLCFLCFLSVFCLCVFVWPSSKTVNQDCWIHGCQQRSLQWMFLLLLYRNDHHMVSHDGFERKIGIGFVVACYRHLLTLMCMYCNFYCVWTFFTCAGVNLAEEMLLDWLCALQLCVADSLSQGRFWRNENLVEERVLWHEADQNKRRKSWVYQIGWEGHRQGRKRDVLWATWQGQTDVWEAAPNGALRKSVLCLKTESAEGQ